MDVRNQRFKTFEVDVQYLGKRFDFQRALYEALIQHGIHVRFQEGVGNTLEADQGKEVAIALFLIGLPWGGAEDVSDYEKRGTRIFWYLSLLALFLVVQHTSMPR